MLVRKEYDFDIFTDCWSGAKERVDSLTSDLADKLANLLEDDEIWGGVPTDTQVNDFIWFEDDTYADWLGFDDAQQMWDYCEAVNNGIDEDEIWKDPDGRIVSSSDVEERFDAAFENEEFDEGDYDSWEDWADWEGYEKFDLD